eukprot:365661-Chlamydomonas_euryale.AAC.55
MSLQRDVSAAVPGAPPDADVLTKPLPGRCPGSRLQWMLQHAKLQSNSEAAGRCICTDRSPAHVTALMQPGQACTHGLCQRRPTGALFSAKQRYMQAGATTSKQSHAAVQAARPTCC